MFRCVFMDYRLPRLQGTMFTNRFGCPKCTRSMVLYRWSHPLKASVTRPPHSALSIEGPACLSASYSYVFYLYLWSLEMRKGETKLHRQSRSPAALSEDVEMCFHGLLTDCLVCRAPCFTYRFGCPKCAQHQAYHCAENSQSRSLAHYRVSLFC